MISDRDPFHDRPMLLALLLCPMLLELHSYTAKITVNKKDYKLKGNKHI